MKNIVLGSMLFLLAGSLSALDRGELSLKAGPTQPGEALSLVWVEVFVAPKIVKTENQLELGIRTTSKVRSVKAVFDFSSEQVSLASPDGLTWSGTFQLGEKLSDGAHIVRYFIAGKRGTIQRTVEFFVSRQTDSVVAETTSIASPEASGESAWDLTVTATATALSGKSVRTIKPGEKLVGVLKKTWYKVVFADGQEGWISSEQVEDPAELYYKKGYEAYATRNYHEALSLYKKALEINDNLTKAYYWRAKTFLAQDNLEAAAEEIQKALKTDNSNLDSRMLADTLAQKFYSGGHDKFRAGRFREAIANFNKAIDLNKFLTQAWIEKGDSYWRLGMEKQAKNTWREALKVEPENNQIRSLLGLEQLPALSRVAATKSLAEKINLAPTLINDSLKIVRDEKTAKGTKIESALRSVVALTKSLGTPVSERGWQVRKRGNKTLVSFMCEQKGGLPESFDWLVDVDTKQVIPNNENARLLMSRW
ncbi:hypothetical protein A2311_06095 [candidate division WOR-1 bacterium RIFOXYB2_FULL_48_7]|uniref:Uncharacterized protein n=1 Tax=candidate division WOR-1 bacterium RIFOXYB2_FULL_48_7 TaxID=1802583 RepID=A0A1F4TS02_UNCSA|nr:MAG: hypothetical protein A2311_06095 [candidate division WOR-1 bacterium RIFOXYB2_FULL_48_7]